MFGKWHRHDLHLWLESGQTEQNAELLHEFTVGIEDRGRAVAKFRSVRFEGAGMIVSDDGIDVNGRFGLLDGRRSPA